MIFDSDCLQALRDCCRDDAAFARLQEILAVEPLSQNLEPLIDQEQTLDLCSPEWQSEIALREERDFIAAVLNTAGALVVVFDRQGRIVRFNRACEQITRYSFDEVRDKPFWDLFLIPQEVELVKTVFQQLQAGQFPIEYANHWVTKDGRRRLINWSGTALLGPQGSVKYIIAIGIDTTERQQAESALRKSEELYRTLARNFPNGAVFLFDRELRYTLAEGRGLTDVGLTKAQLEGKTIWQALPLKICKSLEPAYRAALAGTATTVEVQYDHHVYLLHALPVKNEQGEIFAGMVMSQDVTEQKQAEAALRLSESRLRRQNRVLVELAKRNSLNQGNLDAALQDITQAAANTLEVEQVSVWLYNSDRSQIYCLDLYERSANRHSQGTELLAMHYPAYFRALETERILAVDDAHTDPRTLEFSESYLKRLGISSMLDAPIWLGGQVIGVVCHEQVGPKRQWGSEEQHFAASIADLVSLAIEARDRQRTEAELRASEERLQSFFNATFEGVLIHEQGQILDVNHAAETLFGYSTAELIGMSVFDLGTPEMHELFAQRLQVLSDQPFEAIGLRKDKATFVVEASGKSILYQGRPARVIGIRDITKRKQAEEELRLSAERDRLLAEISLRIRRSLDLNEILNTTVVEVRKFLQADRVFIGFIKGTNPSLHRHGEIVAEAVDPAWHSCLEVLIKDANYIRHMSMLFEQGEIRVVNNTAESQSSTTSWEYLARYRVCASLEVPIMLRGNAQLHCSHSQTNGHLSAKGTHEHQFFGVLVAHQCSGAREWQPFEIDLLEQLATRVAIAIQQGELYQQLATLNVNLERQVEERTALLQQKMQELQELSQLKDVFMHAVSHDLRTPVMGTLLVLKNLLNPPIRAADPSSEKLAELNRISETIPLPRTVLERMIQSNNRQLMLINSLLEAHASDVRGIVLHHEAVQLHSLIKAILEDLEPLLLKNQAVLSNLVPLDLPLVNIDPTQLRRVFENLIINALKHNPPGLSLTLKAMVEASMLRCTVEDNGVGINQEQAEHLFDLYFRGANARHLTGIGLGLYLCRQIITAHGGQIGVVSAPGAGATFWFTLPLALN